MNNPGKASLPVIKRLPKYYRFLRTLLWRRRYTGK